MCIYHMRWQFITKYTNICYKHHNIHITVSKPAIIIKIIEKMKDDNNEGVIIKIAGGQQWGHLVKKTGCHK